MVETDQVGIGQAPLGSRQWDYQRGQIAQVQTHLCRDGKEMDVHRQLKEQYNRSKWQRCQRNSGPSPLAPGCKDGRTKQPGNGSDQKARGRMKSVETQRKRTEAINGACEKGTDERANPSATQDKAAQSRSDGIDDKEKVPSLELLKMRQIEVHREAAVDKNNDKEFDQGCF